MVHLEAKYEYLEKIRQSSEKKILVDQILLDGPIPTLVLRNDASQVALNLIVCVKTNNKNLAQEIYNQFSKRKPTKESHWIYDEFVVFALSCAIHKFSFDPMWIKEVINFTSQAKDFEQQKINESFKNLLSGNLNVKQDYHQISLVYQFLSKEQQYDNERINKMFRSLWKRDFPFYESTFLNIVSLKAIQIAFEIKGLLSPQDYFDSKEFVNRFKKRTSIISTVWSWILLIIIAILLYLVLWRAIILNEKLISFILSASGVGVAAIFGLRKKLQEVSTNTIRKILGYKVMQNKN